MIPLLTLVAYVRIKYKLIVVNFWRITKYLHPLKCTQIVLIQVKIILCLYLHLWNNIFENTKIMKQIK